MIRTEILFSGEHRGQRTSHGRWEEAPFVQTKSLSPANTADIAFNVVHDQRPLRIGSQLNDVIQLNTLDVLNGQSLYPEWCQAFFPGCVLSKKTSLTQNSFRKLFLPHFSDFRTRNGAFCTSPVPHSGQ